MSKPIEIRIMEFSENRENQIEALKLMRVWIDRGDSAEETIKKMLFNALMRFHCIPLKTGES
jgi:hypothetical protein